MADLERFFKRNKIEIEKILYIYHRDRKTVVCSDPGREIFSSAPLQEVLAFLPEKDFISISRNAIVRRDKILNIGHLAWCLHHARWQDLSGQDKIPKYPQAAEKGNGIGYQKSREGKSSSP